MKLFTYLVVFILLFNRGVEIPLIVGGLNVLYSLVSRTRIAFSYYWLAFLLLPLLYLEEYVTIYSFFRDVAYFFTPLSIILLGRTLHERNVNLKQVILNVSIIFSIFYLASWRPPSAYSTFYQWQLAHGFVPLGLVFVAILLFEDGRLKRIPKVLLYLVNISSLSRFILGGLILYVGNKYRRLIMLVVPIALIIAVQASITYDADRTTLKGKIVTSFDELVVSDDISDSELHGQWRGYEILLFVRKLTEASFYNRMFGFGYGSMLSLGRTWRLDGQSINEIPRLHNGFMTVFMKGGVVGSLLYFILILRFSREIHTAKKMRFVILLLLFVQSFVFAGIFSPEMMLFNLYLGFAKK